MSDNSTSTSVINFGAGPAKLPAEVKIYVILD
jgi:phosphoserine aminotransferase